MDVEANIGPSKKFQLFCSLYYRTFILILVPIVLCPIIVLYYTKPFQYMYIALVMMVYWIFEPMPVQVTALIPIVLFPVFGILNSEQICVVYFSSTIVFFIAGMMIAIAVEYSQLHKRIALHVIKVFGFNLSLLHFIMMILTAFISMWLPNTATAAMICPIVAALLQQCESLGIGRVYVESEDELQVEKPTKPTIAYFIGISYAATIGGVSTLIGTGTNMVMNGIFELRFPDEEETISFGFFIMFMICPMIILLCCTCFWLQLLYMGLLRPASEVAQSIRINKEMIAEIRSRMSEKIEELGTITLHEIFTLVLFLLGVILCCTKSPENSGWSDVLHPDKDSYIKYSAPFMLVVILMFIIPASCVCCNFCLSNRTLPVIRSPSVLEWSLVNRLFPWHLIFLLGGGFAIASGAVASGASDWFAERMEGFQDFPKIGVLLITYTITMIFTNFMSNMAICNIMLSILLELALAMKIHPLYLMLPNGLASSMAFMLPVGTPANAMVVVFANVETKDLIVSGIGPTIFSIILIPVVFPYWGKLIFPFLFESFTAIASNTTSLPVLL